MKRQVTLLLCSLLWLSLNSTSSANNFISRDFETSVTGDANCDGNTDLFDIICILNFIMGNNPQPFCFANADINNDGNINSIDIVGITNLIINGGPFVCNVSLVVDIDGNAYNTLLIGNQCWMKDNLKTTKYRDGSNILYPGNNSYEWAINTSGAFAWYNNDIGFKNIYGALYNWYAVNNMHGLCPEGWHVPSDMDWNTLILSMDPNAVQNIIGTQSYFAGGMMKSTLTVPSPHPRWNYPNAGATNQSMWSGLPGGYRFNNGYYNHLGTYGYWWSSSVYFSNSSLLRVLGCDTGYISRNDYMKAYGTSVRCLKDD